MENQNYDVLEGTYFCDKTEIIIRRLGKTKHRFIIENKIYDTWTVPLFSDGVIVEYELDGDFGKRRLAVKYGKSEAFFDASQLGVEKLFGVFLKRY